MEKYSSTLFLPKTSFRIRYGGREKERELINHWKSSHLLEARSRISRDSSRFIIHDGPPYANGHLHMGHALNKVLKDMIGRFFYLYGRKVQYKPGWDCHGLPIEWMVEQEYRKQKKQKEDVPVLEFRDRCRKFADQWVETQKEEFQALGVLANWDDVYKTMEFGFEADLVRQLLYISSKGHLYESYKPVLWSVVEETSLAEAEVEYKDINSRAMFVKFPLEDLSASFLIWTTTPWTLPANRGLAYSRDLSYSVYEHKGELLILADELFEYVKERSGSGNWSRKSSLKSLEGMKCRHPFFDSDKQNFGFSVPLLSADFVVGGKGTGIVHVAPSHGEDDFNLAQQNRFCEVEEIVDGKGLYTIDGWQHIHIFKALPVIRDILLKGGRLLSEENYHHSYPHSWRSGSPLIYRAAKQLFFDLTLSGILSGSAKEIEKNIHFVPANAKQRLKSTIESRPDWLISRQRCWGVPITLFAHKETGRILCDPEVNQRIVEYVKKEGGDAWFSRPNEDFFGDRKDAEDFQKMKDILDVWFDSGCSHISVLGDSQADLYIEGSDQHRGWFQSSLLVEMHRRGRSPYKGLVSHGFVLDEKGHKMSKSQGNVITPDQVLDRYSADLIRIWVASSDYTRDLRIGQSILKSNEEALYKFRNTLRFILGNLCRSSAGMDLPDLENTKVLKDADFLDKWILHRLAKLSRDLQAAVCKYDIHGCYLLLHEFCDKDLSSLYFDVLKDTLYCDLETSRRRSYAIAALYKIFYYLIHLLGPIIPFTVEEAMLEFNGSDFGKEYGHKSAHHLHGIQAPDAWFNEDMHHRSKIIFAIRKVVNGCLEEARKERRIGSSNEAFPLVFLSHKDWHSAVEGVNMKEICLVSDIEFRIGDEESSFKVQGISEVGVLFRKSDGSKCPRCWIYHSGQELCKRCEKVVSKGK